MRFSEQETALIVMALRSRAFDCEVNRLRQDYAGMMPEGRGRCARRVDEYRAERDALETLITRLEYVAGAA